MSDLLIEIGADGSDFVLEDGDLKLDASPLTGVLCSLFSDARRGESDPPPEIEDLDPRGWWADTVSDRFGSKLWLWERAKNTPTHRGFIRAAVQDSLRWLVEDDIAESVEVTVERVGTYGAGIRVEITRGKARGWPRLWQGIRNLRIETNEGVVVHLIGG